MPAERIVSLLPSATEIVCALGLEARLVGISHSCDYPPSVNGLPRLSRPRTNLEGLSSGEIDVAIRTAMRDYGSVYEIDTEAIQSLEPDLILTQGICDVCAVPESQVVHTLKSGPNNALRFKRSDSPGPLLRVGTQIMRLDAHDLAAIFASIRDVGCATGVSDRAEDLIVDLQRRIAAVRATVAGRSRPRVLALEWLDPPYVPGHWVPELVAAAGGELLAGTARRPSYRMEWADLQALEPDVLLVMPCGFNLEETQREAIRHKQQLRAVGGRVQLLDASAYFSRSGPRVVDGLEILASAIFGS
ncbi:MAG: cobalamin-binding protein [Gemmatimonadetes bacterium]|nr:MAG: cobalamin-binding protein [Gemmatimonadota bacterium]